MLQYSKICELINVNGLPKNSKVLILLYFRDQWGKLQGHLINYLRFIRLFVAELNSVYIEGIKSVQRLTSE